MRFSEEKNSGAPNFEFLKEIFNFFSAIKKYFPYFELIMGFLRQTLLFFWKSSKQLIFCRNALNRQKPVNSYWHLVIGCDHSLKPGLCIGSMMKKEKYLFLDISCLSCSQDDVSKSFARNHNHVQFTIVTTSSWFAALNKLTVAPTMTMQKLWLHTRTYM